MGKMAEKETLEEIEWIPKQFMLDDHDETSYERLVRKCKETPAVPLGIMATLGALTYGLVNLYKDKRVNQQYAMRARVGFQGFTLVAIMYSMYAENERRKKKQQEGEDS